MNCTYCDEPVALNGIDTYRWFLRYNSEIDAYEAFHLECARMAEDLKNGEIELPEQEEVKK